MALSAVKLRGYGRWLGKNYPDVFEWRATPSTVIDMLERLHPDHPRRVFSEQDAEKVLWYWRGESPAKHMSNRGKVQPLENVETKIGSIIQDTPDNRRGDIVLREGRLVCDGTDITPRTGIMTAQEARKSVEQMYGEKRAVYPVWGLKMHRNPRTDRKSRSVPRLSR